MYPLTRGAGLRVFPEEGEPGNLSPAACDAHENGVLYLNYRHEA